MRKFTVLLLSAAFLGVALLPTAAAASNNPFNVFIPVESESAAPAELPVKGEPVQAEPPEDGEEPYEDWDSDADNGEMAEDSGFTDADLYLAAQLIWAEGKSQSDESFEAMACVLYNRLKSKRFPATVEKVVFQKNQFTVTRDREGFLALEPGLAARAAVYKVFVEGERPLPADVMFFKSARLNTTWGNRVYYDTIGGNMYYS